MSNQDSRPIADGRLSDRALTLVRIAWLLVAAAGIGVSTLGASIHYMQWTTACSGAACAYGQLTSQQAQQLQQSGLSMQFWAGIMVFDWLFPQLAYLIVAAVIIWRRPDDRMALIASFMLVAFGLASSIDFQSPSPTLQFLVLLYQAIGNTSIGFFIFLFPDGRFMPRWTRWLLLFAIVRESLGIFYPDSNVITSLGFVLICLAIIIQIYRYRHISNVVHRQQAKWIVFGIVGSLSGTTAMIAYFSFLYPAINPAGSPSSMLTDILAASIHNLLLLLVPLSFGVAILRSHLWDIDIIIRRTLVYSTLTVILAAVYVAVVVLVQQIIRALTGQTSDVAIVISTLAVATLFARLRSRIQAIIDQRLYRTKYDVQKTLENFSAAARDETDLTQLSERLVAVVGETMQPRQISLWLAEPRRHGEDAA